MQDEIDYYKSLNGRKYAKEFLDGIFSSHKQLWIQINTILKHIRNRQNRKRPFTASLGNGLFEERARSNTLQARINFCYDKDGIKLLNGYLKNDRRSMNSGIAFGRKLLKEKNKKEK